MVNYVILENNIIHRLLRFFSKFINNYCYKQTIMLMIKYTRNYYLRSGQAQFLLLLSALGCQHWCPRVPATELLLATF